MLLLKCEIRFDFRKNDFWNWLLILTYILFLYIFIDQNSIYIKEELFQCHIVIIYMVLRSFIWEVVTICNCLIMCNGLLLFLFSYCCGNLFLKNNIRNCYKNWFLKLDSWKYWKSTNNIIDTSYLTFFYECCRNRFNVFIPATYCVLDYV